MPLTIIGDELVKDNYRLATDARAFSRQILQHVFLKCEADEDGNVTMHLSKEAALELAAMLHQLADNVNPVPKS
jgi:hypothetical protein